MAGPIEIQGDLSISGTSKLDASASNYAIDLDGNWGVTSTNADPFNQRSCTVTFSGSAAQSITTVLAAGETYYNLIIDNSSTGVTLSSKANVTNVLTLTSGLVNTTSANILIMTAGSTTSAGTDASTSYINGPMKYEKNTSGSSVLNFPIGKSPDCRPVVLTLNHSNTTLYNYQGEVFNADPWGTFGSGASDMPATVDTISGVHYTTIARTDGAAVSQPTAGLSGNQTIKMFFGVNDEVYQGSTLTIVKNTTATPATWIDIGGSCALGFFGTPQSGNVTSTSSPSTFTSFSSFALGSKPTGWNSLPIELLNFSATPNKNKVDLKWTTSTETNNKYFTVEKSNDGQKFTELTTVNTKAANGNSTSKLDYLTTDASPLAGTSYYRLKQTDFNGKYKYFNIVSVSFEKSKEIMFTVYPNPNQGQFKADFSGIENNHEVQIIMHDEHGKIVYTNSFYAQESVNSVDIIPQEKIGKGIYFCTLVVEGIKYTAKVVVE